MKNNLLLIITFLIFLSCNGKYNQQESLPKYGLLWKITGNGIQSPSYLFGTFHEQGGMSVLDSIQSFDSIFISTDQFICEMDLRNAVKLLTKKKDSKSNSYLKPWPNADSTYVNLLTDKQKSILDSAINKDESLRIIREWNLRPVQALSFIKYQSQKNAKINKFPSKDNSYYDSVRTIILDVYLQQQANKYNMNIEELDSMEEFQKLNDSINSRLPTMSYKSEVEFMIYSIQNYQKIDSLQKEYINKLLTLYLQQDIALIGQQQKEVNRHNNMIMSFLGNENFIEIQEKMLIDERNNFWMKKITNLIIDNSCFIAVGAGHLGGEKGLINQLRNLNYSVVSVEKTKK
ncbi:TraB/GumN family protein [Wenyingzhuangia marina]|uniref:Uncharacterized conserved protein YbaP, TraB family n=1 Tax=Wenyingzhuangia marina TaxID=1195760 RepID=A0A1M5U4W3_9FLAO|nr:TraB/GumN family protein [Wenyingzhuangia marina]GGF69584.1 hypothetical protein GCM10011397_10660 [Wenyingzhuangia marina]SHH57920.1 Uncharacterized conserved protein YbaP, TraB family [Wenyingzhuangia marina]